MISGSVLRAIRAGLGKTQAQFAEDLGVSTDLVQAWEAGRRPLSSVRIGDLFRHYRVMQRLGVRPAQIGLLKQALEADLIVTEVLRSSTVPDLHPLALTVPDRTMTELLAWPLTGQAPRELGDAGGRSRFPLPDGECDELADRLRATVDQCSNAEAGAMLRRQVKYLLAQHEPSRPWVEEVTGQERRTRPRMDGWSPEWAVERSAVVSEAINGDPEPLHRFIREGLALDGGMTANLNYWAYWTGEISVPWACDADMVTTELSSWGGERLLASLIEGLVGAPYRELCAHSVWALIGAKPYLVRSGQNNQKLMTTIDNALSIDALDRAARERLGQVAFLVRSVG